MACSLPQKILFGAWIFSCGLGEFEGVWRITERKRAEHHRNGSPSSTLLYTCIKVKAPKTTPTKFSLYETARWPGFCTRRQTRMRPELIERSIKSRTHKFSDRGVSKIVSGTCLSGCPPRHEKIEVTPCADASNMFSNAITSSHRRSSERQQQQQSSSMSQDFAGWRQSVSEMHEAHP